MAALDRNRDPFRHEPEYLFEDPVAADTKIFKGAAVLVDPSGNLINAASGATGIARGVALEHCDNTGGEAGDKRCKVRSGLYEFHRLSGSAPTVAHLEQVVYFQDNQTVSTSSNGGARPAAGKLKKITVTGKAVVATGPLFSVDGDLLAANNLDDVANAATARANLGAGDLESTNNLDDVDDPAIARANLGANKAVLDFRGLPLDNAGTFRLPLPFDCTVVSIRSVTSGATTATGAATLTASIEGVAIVGGVVTIASGDPAGTKDSATPTDDNEGSAGDTLAIVVDPNSQDAAATADVSVLVEY